MQTCLRAFRTFARLTIIGLVFLLAFGGYDARGNRTSEGREASLNPNALDEITSRTVLQRGFAVNGTVNPKAKVAVKNPLVAGWQGVPVDPQTGSYFGWWPVPSTYQDGQVARLQPQVRGVLPPETPGGHPEIAELTVNVTLPPALEHLSYDSAGRLLADAYWIYGWDAAGRLTSMTRQTAALPAPGMVSETLAFGYDAEGRRTSKTHVTQLVGNHYHEEESRVLWAGWQPILEVRSRQGDGQVTPLGQRWFQWGADVSGTVDGAAGIGGLVAIIEEDANGAVTRTLLPLEDGLGNICAVVDAANNQTVARYDCGPFGETLHETGETEACPFRWQTKWYDAECQHYYFGYRHYDPRLGRWLSRDPLGEAGGVNLYAYCGNDPANRHDPMGLAFGFRFYDHLLHGEFLEAAKDAPILLMYSVNDVRGITAIPGAIAQMMAATAAVNKSQGALRASTFAMSEVSGGNKFIGGINGVEMAVDGSGEAILKPLSGRESFLQAAEGLEQLAGTAFGLKAFGANIAGKRFSTVSLRVRPGTSTVEGVTRGPNVVAKRIGLRIAPYRELSRQVPGQAHHLNQTGAYRDVIPREQGLSIELEGNIFTDSGAPHTVAHRSLERFWDTFRGTDIVPTNLQYTRALQESLRAAGLSETQVQEAVRAAVHERLEAGLLGGLEVPPVPSPIRNLAQ